MGGVQLTIAVQDEELTGTLMFDGQPDITGAVVSFKVMVNEHELVLPAASFAVSVISCVVFCPLSTVPAAGDCVNVAPVQLSMTVAV